MIFNNTALEAKITALIGLNLERRGIVPAERIDTQQALAILDVTFVTLSEWVKKGLLKPFPKKNKTDKLYFSKAEVSFIALNRANNE